MRVYYSNRMQKAPYIDFFDINMGCEIINVGGKVGLFMFLIVIASSTSTGCVKHECYDSQKVTFDTETCIYKNISTSPNIWYHKSCETSGTECLPFIWTSLNYTCQNATSPTI